MQQGGGGHHRTPSGGVGGGLPANLSSVNTGYLGMGMGGIGGIHAAQAYGMATPRLMQASTAVRNMNRWLCLVCVFVASPKLEKFYESQGKKMSRVSDHLTSRNVLFLLFLFVDVRILRAAVNLCLPAM